MGRSARRRIASMALNRPAETSQARGFAEHHRAATARALPVRVVQRFFGPVESPSRRISVARTRRDSARYSGVDKREYQDRSSAHQISEFTSGGETRVCSVSMTGRIRGAERQAPHPRHAMTGRTGYFWNDGLSNERLQR